MTRAPLSLRWLAAVGAALTASAAGAQQDEADSAFDRTPEDCIPLSLIDSTDAIDDQNIIFHMRGRKAYRSHLPRKCPGLAREDRFQYETRGGRLCSIDTITVLERFGVGFQRGFTCRLGEFVPLSPEELEDLEFREDDNRPAQAGIEAKPVDLEGDEGADAEAEEPVEDESAAEDRE
jgi:hypothetical protein